MSKNSFVSKELFKSTHIFFLLPVVVLMIDKQRSPIHWAGTLQDG
jgi:hypothetical protein